MEELISTIPVAELPIGMVICYNWAGTKTMTITKVTHHKKMRTVQVDGIETSNNEPITLRYLEGVVFAI